MSIYRLKRNRPGAYVPRETAHASLPFDSLGLLCWLLAHGDGWEIQAQGIYKEAKRRAVGGRGGRDSAQRMIKNLEQAGYIYRKCRRNPNGSWYWESIISDVPRFNGKGEADQAPTVTGPAGNGLAVDGSPGNGATGNGRAGDGLPGNGPGGNQRTPEQRTKEEKSSSPRVTDDDIHQLIAGMAKRLIEGVRIENPGAYAGQSLGRSVSAAQAAELMQAAREKAAEIERSEQSRRQVAEQRAEARLAASNAEAEAVIERFRRQKQLREERSSRPPEQKVNAPQLAPQVERDEALALALEKLRERSE